MTRDEFIKWRAEDWDVACEAVLKSKGPDYSDASDAFDNFKRRGKEAGITPEQAWAVLAGKHWDAIMTFVRDGKVRSEPICGRLLDLRNFLDLLASHLTDHPGVMVKPNLRPGDIFPMEKVKI